MAEKGNRAANRNSILTVGSLGRGSKETLGQQG
jgi:hypothetical protein